MLNIHQKYVKETCRDDGVIEKLEVHYPDNFNFSYDVVDEIAAKEPEKRAMLWVNDQGEVRDFTFADMKRYSDKTAHFLKSQGIKKGDMVMVVLKRHYQYWFAICGLHKLGAVAIPATNLLTKKDFVYRFESASVAGVICTADGDVADYVDEAVKECPMVKVRMLVRANEASRGKPVKEGWLDFDKGLEEAPEQWERVDTKATDPILLYFTSGTTGYPKMVLHDHSYPLGHIATAKHWHNVKQDGLHLTLAETGWAKAAWGKIYGQWLMEAPVFVYDFNKFTSAELMEIISKYKVTTFCAPPTIFRFFIKEDLTKFDLSHLQYVTIAGEALNPEVFNQFKNATGLKLMEGFGQTETTLSVFNSVGMDPKPGSMGIPSPQYDVEIVDEEGNPTAPGVTGEIVVKTGDTKPIGVFCGYYRNEELTKQVWHDGVYHTGDTAWKDEDGYYWYVGRMDDIIKSSGYRIGPFEIESVLMEHPSVLECAVTGVPDPVRSQVIKATIVLARGYEKSEELKKELQAYVKEQTAPYKYPRVVEFVDELPKTISGKIRRKEIREGKEE